MTRTSSSPTTALTFAGMRRAFLQRLRSLMPRTTVFTDHRRYVCWLDAQGRLGWVTVVAYITPDPRDPQAPLITRVSVNYLTPMTEARAERRLRRLTGLPRIGGWKATTPTDRASLRWKLELSTLPDELLDFAPWVIRLVEAHDRGSAESLPKPPYPLEGSPDDILKCDYAWTACAGDKASAYYAGRRPR